MRPRIISLACLLLAAMTMAAQGIKRHEYWIDADYSHHQTVSGGTTASVTVSTEGLAPGIHFFNHRAQSTDDTWGTLYRALFYMPGDAVGNVTIGSYEYWVDANYAHRVKGGSSTHVKATIDVSQLKPGLHFLNFLANDNQGHEGTLSRSAFFIPEMIDTNATKVEYWIDNDYAHAADIYIQTPFHPTDQSNNDGSLIIPIIYVDISQLKPGLHFFNHRDVNINGEYGCLHRSAFFVPQVEMQDLVIEEYEYWIDDNTPTTQTVGYAQSVFQLTCDVSALAEGEHTFSFRAKNSNGWGDIFADTFVIEAGGEVPDEPQLTATFSVVNAIDGVVYENKLITSVEYTNISAERQKFTPTIYQSQLTDGEWTGRRDIYSGGSWTLKGGESCQTGIYGRSRSDGRYKLEYGYWNADYTKEYTLGSTEVEVKADNRYVTIVQDDEMMTYCDENDLDFSAVSGLKAYTAEGFNTAKSEALLMRANEVPAETGLLLVGSPRAYLVPKQTSSTVYVNMLVGVLEGQPLPLTSNDYTNFIFERGSNGLGFYPPYTNNYVYGHQAYLQIPTQAAGNSEFISIKLDDTNGISETNADGTAFNIYTLNGILVKRGATSTQGLPSGIYIVNGSKTVIK
ncbi:MAG: hypothetical protein K6B13_01380 [Prevotella sp.]|nr:hypothetical protein [Prevotella sp.]